ncbi:hypothetical protein STENM36S_03167 [Streptomyces tendae]
MFLLSPSMPGVVTMPYFTPLSEAVFISEGWPFSMPTSPLANAAKASARSSLPGATGPVRPLPTSSSRSQVKVVTFCGESTA